MKLIDMPCELNADLVKHLKHLIISVSKLAHHFHVHVGLLFSK
jgi:hypothetical protein